MEQIILNLPTSVVTILLTHFGYTPEVPGENGNVANPETGLDFIKRMLIEDIKKIVNKIESHKASTQVAEVTEGLQIS